jgi:hypothetical protein
VRDRGWFATTTTLPSSRWPNESGAPRGVLRSRVGVELKGVRVELKGVEGGV